MNGIKLKNNELPPLKVERIKWMILIVISHILSFLLMSSPAKTITNQISKTRDGYIRLQLPLTSQVALNRGRTPVILMTENQNIISRDAELIQRVVSREGIDSRGLQYLVDLPEKDLEKIIKIKNKKLLAYPASKIFRPSKKTRTKESYEIHF